MTLKEKSIILIFTLLLAIFASGCSQPVNILQALPGADAVTGWRTPGDPQVFDKDTIFQLMDGQAEFFFRYGFEQVAVRSYQNTEGNNLDVEIWQLATTDDAYGLFSVNDSDEPATLGKANEANIQEGNRIVFWQNRYFALVRSAAPVPNMDLLAFAESVSKSLPSGGTIPGIMKRLPAEGKVERSDIFFHEEISIQNVVWLGGENNLGLSPQTNGTLARYQINAADLVFMLIDFPDAQSASSALAAMQNGEVEDLLVARTEDKTLGAVFGKADHVVGEGLLAKGLAPQ